MTPYLNGQKIVDWTMLVNIVRSNPKQKLLVEIVRNGEEQIIPVYTDQQKIDTGYIGRIGAGPAQSESLTKEYFSEVMPEDLSQEVQNSVIQICPIWKATFRAYSLLLRIYPFLAQLHHEKYTH